MLSLESHVCNGCALLSFWLTSFLPDITYTVLNYLEQDWICTALLPESGRKNDNKYYNFVPIDSEESNTDKKPKICLAVNYLVDKNSLLLSLFSPYWLVNQTNAVITYRIDDEHVYRQTKSLDPSPFLLAFNPENVSKENKLSLSISNSSYSDYFPLNVVPYHGSFLPRSFSKQYKYYVNVRVELASIGVSKIVTVSSFYNVYNISKHKVEYSEGIEEQWFALESKLSMSFFPTKNQDQTMCFRFANSPEFVSKVCVFVFAVTF